VVDLAALDGGAAVTNTTVGLSPYVPPTSRSPLLRLQTACINNGDSAHLGAEGDGANPQADTGQMFVIGSVNATRGTMDGFVEADASQKIRYANTNVWVPGYAEAS
jgi:hypothetical protein